MKISEFIEKLWCGKTCEICAYFQKYICVNHNSVFEDSEVLETDTCEDWIYKNDINSILDNK